jgi:tetratricopeptide (TPR) repeat protein
MYYSRLLAVAVLAAFVGCPEAFADVGGTVQDPFASVPATPAPPQSGQAVPVAATPTGKQNGLPYNHPTAGDDGDAIGSAVGFGHTVSGAGLGAGNLLKGVNGMVPNTLPNGNGIKASVSSAQGQVAVPGQNPVSGSAALQSQTPDAEAARTQAVALAQSGDNAGALNVAQAALAQHPDDKALQAFVQGAQRTASTSTTLAQRAHQLLSTLRGDSGDAPPAGAAILASPLPMAMLGGAGGAPPLSPAAMSAAGIGARDVGLRTADPLVRDAASKFAIHDFQGSESLLNRRLQVNPSDESALRLRAFARRQMKQYQPSKEDAGAAVALAPWDSRAHRLLIDDEVSLGHSDEALAEANRALAATPGDAQLYAARGNAYGSLGKTEQELADYKQAAALDAQFDQLYEQASLAASGATSKRPRSSVVWFGAIGTALLFFSFALFRKRGDSSVRLAMRAEDHALLSRGARPEAAPAGFKIVKTLGQGGMGVVYEALDLGLQRPVALKKLRAEIADSPRERGRFLKEARTVAALKHPNIVEIHSIHEDAEGLFLVFEKINGQSLHERLGAGALRPAEAVGYLRQIASALDHAHSAGVVHQDLKPANVMISGGSAKVMDFGIARRVQETMSTLSRVEVAGTPAYMAPEQERGGAVGPAADVFALGACAYELLAGRTPFPNGGMMMKAEKKYRPASDLDPSLPKAADAVIARALEPEPAARWPSASSFVEALARSLS